MASLMLVGWKPGLKVISLIELLRSQAGLSLREAKASAEKLLTGESVSVSFGDAMLRDGFRRAAEELGVEVETKGLQSPRNE